MKVSANIHMYFDLCINYCDLMNHTDSKTYPIMDIVSNWPPDQTALPPRHFHSLCRFDFKKDLATALAYRDAEAIHRKSPSS